MKTSSKFKRFALARFEALDIEGIDKANAKKLRIALEREILSRTATASDQTEALNGLVAELNALGHRLVPVKSDPGWTSYHQHTNNGERTLHIHAQFDPVGTSVMVLYSETLERTVAIRRAGMTPAERKRADIESEYLERGLALNTSGQSYSSLGPTDRLIACLHELEGSVSNGGFGTYLSNTGGARLADAHRYLTRIGARRTARLVADVRALLPRGFTTARPRDREGILDKHRDQLDALSGRFYELTERVPMLAMRYVKSKKSPRKRRRRP